MRWLNISCKEKENKHDNCSRQCANAHKNDKGMARGQWIHKSEANEAEINSFDFVKACSHSLYSTDEATIATATTVCFVNDRTSTTSFKPLKKMKRLNFQHTGE